VVVLKLTDRPPHAARVPKHVGPNHPAKRDGVHVHLLRRPINRAAAMRVTLLCTTGDEPPRCTTGCSRGGLVGFVLRHTLKDLYHESRWTEAVVNGPKQSGMEYTYICCGIPALALPQCASLLSAQQVRATLDGGHSKVNLMYVCCGVPALALPQCASLLAAQQVTLSHTLPHALSLSIICCGVPSIGLPQCASLLAAQQVIFVY